MNCAHYIDEARYARPRAKQLGNAPTLREGDNRTVQLLIITVGVAPFYTAARGALVSIGLSLALEMLWVDSRG